MKRQFTSIAIASVAILGAAQADEVWTTEIGDVIYEADLENGMAVLSYPTDSDQRGIAFLPGLAGEYTGRTLYEGYWIEPAYEDGGCDIEMAAPDSQELSNNWGRVTVVFVDPDYPGSFVAIRGDCFEEPEDMLVARPVTASAK